MFSLGALNTVRITWKGMYLQNEGFMSDLGAC